MEKHALARACADAMWADDRASQGLGMELLEVGPGSATIAMVVTERMTNGHGMCHGGFIFSLADSTFAFACNTDHDRCVAAQCTITYLTPAKLGDRLIATATERVRAGRSGITDVRITTGDGAVVAEFRGHSRTTGAVFFKE